jgi:hypothetical protein
MVDPQMLQEIKALLGSPRPMGMNVAPQDGSGGMFDQLVKILSGYSGASSGAPTLGPGIGAAQGLAKPMVGQPTPGVADSSAGAMAPSRQIIPSQPQRSYTAAVGNRIPIVHDRTGASADSLSNGQRQRFERINSLYGQDRAYNAKRNMLEENKRYIGNQTVPTTTVPAVAPQGSPDLAMQAAMRRTRAIEARPETPRARRR